MRSLTTALVRVATITVVISPALSDAQDLTAVPVPATETREHVSIGLATTGVVGALPWAIVSGRISMPVATRFGLDVDAGGVVGTKRLNTGQVPTGVAAEVHLRWLYKGRGPSGMSSYVFGGPRVVAAKNIDQQGHVTDRKPIQAIDLGWGFDRRLKNRWRTGVEFGAGAGEGPLVFVDVFVLWGRM
jgi:hypothetical protein